MPKIIASRSITKVAMTMRRAPAKRRPSTTARKPGRAALGWGGMGAISSRAARLARNVTTSKANAVATPDSWINTPAKAGPTTLTAW